MCMVGDDANIQAPVLVPTDEGQKRLVVEFIIQGLWFMLDLSLLAVFPACLLFECALPKWVGFLAFPVLALTFSKGMKAGIAHERARLVGLDLNLGIVRIQKSVLEGLGWQFGSKSKPETPKLLN